MSALLQTHKPEQPDAFLARLDEIQKSLNALRDAYHFERSLLHQAVRAIAEPASETLTPAEAAALAEVKESTLRAGSGGTRCLYMGRIKNGRSVRYYRAQVEMHVATRDQKGSCDSCDVEFRKAKVIQMQR